MLKYIKTLFSMLWKYRKSYYLLFFLIVLLQAAGSIVGVLLPRYLIDSLTQRQFPQAAVLAGILCLTIFFIAAVSILAQYQKDSILQGFRLKLTAKLAKCAHSIFYEQYEDFKVREEYQFAVKCADEGSAGQMMDYMMGAVSAFLSLFGLLYLMSYVVWWLWGVIVVSIIINAVCEAYRLRYNYESTQSQNAVEMRMLYARDRLTWKSFAKEIRLFDMYDYVVQTAEHYIDALSAIHKERASKTFRALFWSYLFNGIQMIAVYAYVGYKCSVGDFSIGEFSMLTLAILSVSRLTGSIAADFMAVRQQGLYLRNYFSFLAYAEDEMGTRDVRADADGKIVFDNVRFAYPGSDTNALNGVSYTFQVGKKYGLVGANGSGKTTFIHLLMGLYHATEGQIRINGDAVETINREQYYALFAPVLQDFNTYAYSIRENVAFAERDGDEKITQLMDAMKLTKRLSQLPSGISTNLTTEYESEGTELSGGELQKIAIMRAFYKDTPILVLDEPTSALSPKSECELYQEINEMAAGKTVFFISHRMASCRMCDEILVFDGGSIVESGTHEALMQRDGLYRQMFSAQASLYAEETT